MASSPGDHGDSQVTALAADIEKLNLRPRSESTPTCGPTKETAIFLQDVCLLHRFIRSRDTSAIVEKPERMRAVNIGLAAAMAHLEESFASTLIQSAGSPILSTASTSDDLAAALGRMNLATKDVDPLEFQSSPISVVKSVASADMLNHAAVKFIHGDVDGDIYLENLKRWARDSHGEILKGGSEIPEGLSQGDLYRMYSHSFVPRYDDAIAPLQSVLRLWTLFKAPSAQFAQPLTL
jgi:histone deacetylase HOS3